jgi:hypothetical protein
MKTVLNDVKASTETLVSDLNTIKKDMSSNVTTLDIPTTSYYSNLIDEKISVVTQSILSLSSSLTTISDDTNDNDSYNNIETKSDFQTVYGTVRKLKQQYIILEHTLLYLHEQLQKLTNHI